MGKDGRDEGWSGRKRDGWINPFNVSWSKLLLFEAFRAILV